MVKTMKRLWFLVSKAVLVVALVSSSGCGEEAPTGKQPKAPGEGGGPAKSAKKTAVAAVSGTTAKPSVSKNWEVIRGHFLGAAGRPGFVGKVEAGAKGTSLTFLASDAFQSNVSRFFPDETPATKKTKAATAAPKTQDPKAAKAKADEEKTLESILAGIISPTGKGKKGVPEDGVLVEPPTPLTSHPLASYTFRILMTGVSDPVAVVEIPGGTTAQIRRNDRLGSEGAYVEDILTQKVLIRVPDRTDLLEVSLAARAYEKFFQN
jgi:hypothetical protein